MNKDNIWKLIAILVGVILAIVLIILVFNNRDEQVIVDPAVQESASDINQELSENLLPNNPQAVAEETTSNNCQGKFTNPISGQVIPLNSDTVVEWQMPGRDTYYTVNFYLVDSNQQKVGRIYPGNWVKYNPMTSWKWNTGQVAPIDINRTENTKLNPGKYKLQFEYEYSDTDIECSQQGMFESEYFELI